MGATAFACTASYMRSCLTTGSRCGGRAEATPGGAALAIADVPVDAYRYSVEGLVGLQSWEASRYWGPYLVIGAGGVTYDPAHDALPFVPGTFETLPPPPGTPAGTVVITDGTSTFLIGTSELGLEHVFGLTIGAGMDLRVPAGIGGRVVHSASGSSWSTRSPALRSPCGSRGSTAGDTPRPVATT